MDREKRSFDLIRRRLFFLFFLFALIFLINVHRQSFFMSDTFMSRFPHYAVERATQIEDEMLAVKCFVCAQTNKKNGKIFIQD